MEDNACVGIVYWLSTSETNTPLKDDRILAKEHPECTHGYILALKDASDYETEWQNPYESVYDNFQNIEGSEVYPSDDGYEPISIDYDSQKSIDYNNNTYGEQLNKAIGYNNTKVLRLYNYYGSEADYKVLIIKYLDDFAEVNRAPDGSSGWYIPSLIEMAYIDNAESIELNFGDDGRSDRLKGVQTILEKTASCGSEMLVYNEYYFSSSEKRSMKNGVLLDSYVFDISFYDGHLIGTADKNCFELDGYGEMVRAICAF
jgi:hypothetical protein